MMRFFLILAATLALGAPASAEPPVWIVRDADSEMLIFGSVHVLPPDIAWRPAALDAAVAKADDLWFELPVGPAAEREVTDIAARTGVLGPGKSLLQMLPKRDARRLLRVADIYGVNLGSLDRLEPWLAELVLAGSAYARTGADAQHGVEQVINAAAPSTAVRRAFETPAEQMAFFDEAPLRDQLASLHQSLRDLEHDPKQYMELLEAWRTGDIDRLNTEAVETLRKASPTLFRRLVTERNSRWTDRIDARLKGQGRTVVVVGVGHLVGKGGVPARLRALGYSVTGP